MESSLFHNRIFPIDCWDDRSRTVSWETWSHMHRNAFRHCLLNMRKINHKHNRDEVNIRLRVVWQNLSSQIQRICNSSKVSFENHSYLNGQENHINANRKRQMSEWDAERSLHFSNSRSRKRQSAKCKVQHCKVSRRCYSCDQWLKQRMSNQRVKRLEFEWSWQWCEVLLQFNTLKWVL